MTSEGGLPIHRLMITISIGIDISREGLCRVCIVVGLSEGILAERPPRAHSFDRCPLYSH